MLRIASLSRPVLPVDWTAGVFLSAQWPDFFLTNKKQMHETKRIDLECTRGPAHASGAMSEDEINILWEHVTKECIVRPHSVHGPDHWRRVERNGLLLAQRTGANVVIVRLFALFHDCRRVNDGRDRDHGARGAEHARLLRGRLFDLPDEDFERLHHACTWHTDADHHRDPTIGTCWDADRLDLGRVGMVPDSQFMSTAFARKIADQGDVDVFLSDLAAISLRAPLPTPPKPRTYGEIIRPKQ